MSLIYNLLRNSGILRVTDLGRIHTVSTMAGMVLGWMLNSWARGDLQGSKPNITEWADKKSGEFNRKAVSVPYSLELTCLISIVYLQKLY